MAHMIRSEMAPPDSGRNADVGLEQRRDQMDQDCQAV